MVTTPRPTLTAEERTLIAACLPDDALMDMLTLIREHLSGHVEVHFHTGTYVHSTLLLTRRPDCQRYRNGETRPQVADPAIPG